jgi:hypothetical protein
MIRYVADADTHLNTLFNIPCNWQIPQKGRHGRLAINRIRLKLNNLRSANHKISTNDLVSESDFHISKQHANNVKSSA